MPKGYNVSYNVQDKKISLEVHLMGAFNYFWLRVFTPARK